MATDSWRIVLITPNREISSALFPVVSSEVPFAKVIELPGYPEQVSASDLPSDVALCMIDLITDRTAALKALKVIGEAAPSLPVVSLVPAGDPQIILQALRLGAKDFLTQPFTGDQFRAVIQKLALSTPELASKLGRVISVVPAKGGCGATTISYNLATQLKKLGTAKKTLLADLDPTTGTQAFQMKLKSGFSFLDILNSDSGLDADIWRGVVQSHGGLDVLLSPGNPIEGAQEMGDTKPILDFSRHLYDLSVIDLGNAYGAWTLSAIRASDEVFLVTTNELPALQAAQRVLNYYEGHSIPRSRIQLIVNRFNREVGLTQEMIEKALEMEVYEVIPSDYQSVQRALLDGKSINASSPISKSLVRISERVLGIDGERKKKSPAPARSAGPFSGLINLFSRAT